MNLHTQDVIVIGGGNIGSAVAYGLIKLGVSVAVIDEGDVAFRSARGNFGLVWFQGKGMGMPRYVDWCLEATQRWPDFAEELKAKTGISVDYQKPGGLDLCLGETGCTNYRRDLAALKEQTTGYEYQCEFISRAEAQAMIPRMVLGPKVMGATFSPHDGHVNPLYLLRAMHAAYQSEGGRYYPGQKVINIVHDGKNFLVNTPKEHFSAPKLVLAAGVNTSRLAGILGLDIPVEPVRGQIAVSERVLPTLPYPLSSLRQTAEGSFMFGASKEHAGYDNSVTGSVIRGIIRHALDLFPCLADLRIVRTWGALRPLAPDSMPVYEESRLYPGAFVLTSHSGVSLASVYARHIPAWVIEGEKPSGFDAFSTRRFHVQEN